MDGTNIPMPGMNGANAGGSTKILNFEEFCAAQAGGMSTPPVGNEAPTPPEMELPNPDSTEGGDDVTVLDDTDDNVEKAGETPVEPTSSDTPETPPVD